jgi:prepilin-type N-terminal cleavage/methylation domain-containing protein
MALRERLTQEGGFGLIELMIAMTVMAIGITAIVAGFSSGIIALSNASRTGTAGTLADKQMEAYRALSYAGIQLTNSPSPATDGTYTGDPAYDATNAVPTVPVATCPATTPTCMPVQTAASGLTAPDGRSYRLDTYIVWNCPLGTLHVTTYNGKTFTQASPGCTDTATPPIDQSRPVKKVTIIVRNGATSKIYVRETSTFDQAT